MLRLGSMRKARAKRREFVVMALTGSDICAAIAVAMLVPGTILVRTMDCMSESAIEFRSAVSLVHAPRSTLRITDGAVTAARIAMTASTAMISIKVNAAPDARTFLPAAMSLALTPFGNFRDESQRDSDSKPKVARNELP